MLPVINGDIRFECNSINDMTMIFEEGENAIRFFRVNRRWRWQGFVSAHTIASRVFRYRDSPSNEEMEWMGDFIEIVGRLLDAASHAIERGVEDRINRIEDHRLRRVKDYFGDASAGGNTSTAKAEYVRHKDYVYLMKHTNGLTKIGRSKNPKAREKTLQAEDPRLEMVFFAEADNTVETRLHRIFHSVRVRGEWFALKDRHIDWIVAVVKDFAVKERQRELEEELEKKES